MKLFKLIPLSSPLSLASTRTNTNCLLTLSAHAEAPAPASAHSGDALEKNEVGNPSSEQEDVDVSPPEDEEEESSAGGNDDEEEEGEEPEDVSLLVSDQDIGTGRGNANSNLDTMVVKSSFGSVEERAFGETIK
jgi:hypothetical protein